MIEWEPICDNNGLIRAIKEVDRNDRIVRWDGLESPCSRRGQRNARMILAIPKMLAVLEELDECAAYWSEYDVPLGLHERIKAAIKAGRGES
jgi:hypothetical protein